jgi:hypothetical protein
MNAPSASSDTGGVFSFGTAWQQTGTKRQGGSIADLSHAGSHSQTHPPAKRSPLRRDRARLRNWRVARARFSHERWRTRSSHCGFSQRCALLPGRQQSGTTLQSVIGCLISNAWRPLPLRIMFFSRALAVPPCDRGPRLPRRSRPKTGAPPARPRRRYRLRSVCRTPRDCVHQSGKPDRLA